jgi:hypothetical protein
MIATSYDWFVSLVAGVRADTTLFGDDKDSLLCLLIRCGVGKVF